MMQTHQTLKKSVPCHFCSTPTKRQVRVGHLRFFLSCCVKCETPTDAPLKEDRCLTESVKELARLVDRLNGCVRTSSTHEALMVMNYVRSVIDGMETRLQVKHGVDERSLLDAEEDARL
jgi:hypothetical protein